MRFLTFYLFLCLNLFCENNLAPKIVNPAEEKAFVIAVPSYKNEKYFKRNLDSIFLQKYENYRVIYVDDASPDRTWELVCAYVKERGFADKVTLIRNEENKGAMYNHHMMAHMCRDDEIYVSLDGDDWFAHKNVLNRLNEAYNDDRVWVTYGSWVSFPKGEYSKCREMNKEFLKNGDHRDFGFQWTQLRTFYAALFKRIPVHLFKDHEGKFFSTACDAAYMYNIIDMARDHVYFMPDVMYIYNIESSLNDYKRIKIEQRNLERFIRFREPRLEPLDDWRE